MKLVQILEQLLRSFRNLQTILILPLRHLFSTLKKTDFIVLFTEQHVLKALLFSSQKEKVLVILSFYRTQQTVLLIGQVILQRNTKHGKTHFTGLILLMAWQYFNE